MRMEQLSVSWLAEFPPELLRTTSSALHRHPEQLDAPESHDLKSYGSHFVT